MSEPQDNQQPVQPDQSVSMPLPQAAQPAPDALALPNVTRPVGSMPVPAAPSTSSLPARTLPQQGVTPDVKGPAPVKHSVFDLVLNKMAGGPRYTTDPTTGVKSEVPASSKVSLSGHILAGAVSAMLSGWAAGEAAPAGPAGTRSAGNAAAANAANQSVQQSQAAFRNAPQQQLDQQMVRRAGAIKNTTDELRNQMMADKLHEDDWNRKQDYYNKTQDTWQPVIDTVKSTEKDSGQQLIFASGLTSDQTMEKMKGQAGNYSPIQDGWVTETHADGRVYHLPTFALIKNGTVTVNRDTLLALSPYNSAVKDLLEKNSADNVPLSSTMLIGLEKQAGLAHGTYEAIHQWQVGLGVPAESQISQSVFNERFRSNPALQRQAGDLATALSNVGTQSTAHALQQLQASGKANEIFKLLGVSPDKVQDFIDDKQNEAIADAAKSKNAGKPMTEAIANAILAEPGESADRKNIAQAFLDSQTKQAAKKSGAEATARVAAETAGKRAAETPEIESIAQSLAKGDLTSLKDVTSMRGDQRAKVFARAKELNPNFNTKDVDLKVKTQTAFSTGKQGDQIQSFGTFLEHAGDAAQASAAYRRANSPLINKPLNWIAKNAANDPTYQTYLTSLRAPVEEYMTFLQNNHALTESDKKAGDALLAGELTPAQVEASLKQMAKTAFFRLDELNSRYRRVMNVDFPDLLSDEARNSASILGMGQEAAKYQTGGRMTGGAGGVVPGNRPTAPTHVFSLSAWQKANPNGDTNAAKTAAQKQGYQVVQ